MGPLTTRRELLWLACREKTCCHAKVLVTGHDVRRICATLSVKPWDVVTAVVAEAGAPDGFRLSPGGRFHQLALVKRPGPERACTFLWKVNDGHAQCGLGELRPGVCQAYPAVIVDGMLCANSSACTCRRWSVFDLDGDADRSLLRTLAAEQSEYVALVGRWNEQLGEKRTFRQYCTWLLDAYAGAPA